MKVITVIFGLFLSTLLIYGSTKIDGQQTNSTFEPIAVVELFTSQGCSSCPPADRLLTETIEDVKKSGKKIYALSYHVDYWNRLGWKDPFSNKTFSERQSKYVSGLNINGAYTPQMIVNGVTEFVGSNKTALTRNIELALNTKALVRFFSVATTLLDDKTLKLNYALEGGYKNCSINFALVYLTETTQVKNGENGGRTLTNDNIVTQLKTTNIQSDGIGELNLPLPVGLQKNNTALIAFVQQKNDNKIIGAVKINFTTNSK